MERMHIAGILLVWGGLVWWVTRARYRALLTEQHRVHELCEDAAYRAGIERSRSTPEALTEDEQNWYKVGFRDGERRGLKIGRREADRYVATLGVGKS